MNVLEPAPSPRSANIGLVAGIVALALVLVGGMVFIGRSGGSDAGEDEVGAATPTTAGTAVASIPPPPPVQVPPGGFTADQINQTFGNAIWKVEVSGCGGEGHGSGFAISPRHVVTNWHVVVGDTEPQLVSHDGTKTISGHVIGLNQKPDVALIEVDEDLPNYVGWVDTANLVEGQPLVALGFPLPLGNYTVTSLAIASFELSGENRTGILVDGKVDRGNSGGPSLTSDGKVAGINTAVNVNGISEGGLQTVPYLTSYNAVRSLIDEFVKNTGGPTVPADCAKAGDFKQAKTYGDNPELDTLWDYCEQGDSAACDALSQNATPQTDYYLFGVTCGARVGREGYCYARYGPVLPPK
jgi:S1-C subfamily serine protease